MKLPIFGLAVALLGLAPSQAPAQTLSVGDDAPAIAVSRWAKGEKVERLEPDQTYVVEFWATWCGPCIRSIPHLTELQKQYKDKGVKFVGVSVWEQDQAKVDPFVAEMGDKMDYSVALDEVPKGEKGSKGKMADSWMTASGSNGIPTAFIVKAGKVAWIGHPMGMDSPLAKVTAADFDLAAAASKYREEKAIEGKMMAVFAKLRKLGRAAGEREQLAVIDAAIAEDPAVEGAIGLQKYLLMRQIGDGKASAYGSRLVETALADQAEALNQVAWANVAPDAKGEAANRDVKLALKAATRANEISHGENGAILDTLAKACFDSGDPRRALECQEKAIKLMGDGGEGMKSRLEQYRKAVEADKKP